MSIYQSGDTGFCYLAGHSGAVTLTWNDDTVISVECHFGDHKTCRFANTCELYQKHPVGFVSSYPPQNPLN